jgi:Galactose mutarotase-like
MARHPDERHYGLGDKAGPLDSTGRRFAIDAVDPCGFDAEFSDPLYKMLPFVIVEGPQAAHGIFYDNLATGSVDLGCTIDNYHATFRSYRADDGDLDFYVLAGPTVREVVRRLSWLTGGQAADSTADLYEDDGDMAAWRTDALILSFQLCRKATGLELTGRAQGSFRPAFDRLHVRPVGVAEPMSIGTIQGPVTLQLGD